MQKLRDDAQNLLWVHVNVSSLLNERLVHDFWVVLDKVLQQVDVALHDDLIIAHRARAHLKNDRPQVHDAEDKVIAHTRHVQLEKLLEERCAQLRRRLDRLDDGDHVFGVFYDFL